MRFHPNVSPIGLSNLYTMGVASKKDPRQEIPYTCCLPNKEVRELRARLILEEALETIAGLGMTVMVPTPQLDGWLELHHSAVSYNHDQDPNLEKVIDGCCDVQYVAVGTLMACGAPDAPHMDEVNRANDDKFPGGEATTDANGKYQKPPGWRPPDHQAIMNKAIIDLKLLSDLLVQEKLGAPVK